MAAKASSTKVAKTEDQERAVKYAEAKKELAEVQREEKAFCEEIQVRLVEERKRRQDIAERMRVAHNKVQRFAPKPPPIDPEKEKIKDQLGAEIRQLRRRRKDLKGEINSRKAIRRQLLDNKDNVAAREQDSGIAASEEEMVHVERQIDEKLVEFRAMGGDDPGGVK